MISFIVESNLYTYTLYLNQFDNIKFTFLIFCIMYPEFVQNCLTGLSVFLFGNVADAPYNNRNLNDPKKCDILGISGYLQ